MIATPRELLDTSIAQMQMLTAFLGDQLADTAVESKDTDTPEILACREIRVLLGALIVKVQGTSRLTIGRVRSEQDNRRVIGSTSASGNLNARGQVEGGPQPPLLGLDVGGHRSRLSGLAAQPVAEKHHLRQACHLRQRN